MTNINLTIVVGIEFDDAGQVAWLRAADIALCNATTTVHLCHCYGNESAHTSTRAEELLSAGELQLKQWAAQRLLNHPLIERTETYVGIGKPSEVLRQLAVDVNADLIVVGTHDRNIFGRLTEGSIVRELLSDAPCSIVIAQEKDYTGRELLPVVEPKASTTDAKRSLQHSHTYSYRRSNSLDFGRGSGGSPGIVPPRPR